MSGSRGGSTIITVSDRVIFPRCKFSRISRMATRENLFWDALIEVMHKAWHDANAVEVGHFEWLKCIQE